MDTNIPAELLDLKARFDEWYKTCQCIRSRIPDDLRLAVIDMLRRYPPALICSLCRISRGSLNRLRRAKKSLKKPKSKEAFFILPSPTFNKKLHRAKAMAVKPQAMRRVPFYAILSYAASCRQALMRLCPSYVSGLIPRSPDIYQPRKLRVYWQRVPTAQPSGKEIMRS